MRSFHSPSRRTKTVGTCTRHTQHRSGISTIAGAGTEYIVYVFPGTVPDVLDVYVGDRTVEVIEAGSGTLSASLTASIFARRYVAAASRLPGAVGVLGGTGLIAP